MGGGGGMASLDFLPPGTLPVSLCHFLLHSESEPSRRCCIQEARNLFYGQ